MYFKPTNINGYNVIESPLIYDDRIIVDKQSKIMYVKDLYLITLATEKDFTKALDECFSIAMRKVMNNVVNKLNLVDALYLWAK